jgi:hypothetical protein
MNVNATAKRRISKLKARIIQLKAFDWRDALPAGSLSLRFVKLSTKPTHAARLSFGFFDQTSINMTTRGALFSATPADFFVGSQNGASNCSYGDFEQFTAWLAVATSGQLHTMTNTP